MKPQAALQSIIAFMVRYRIPFVWAGSREGAEYVTYSMLQKYLREIEERFKQAAPARESVGAAKADVPGPGCQCWRKLMHRRY